MLPLSLLYFIASPLSLLSPSEFSATTPPAYEAAFDSDDENEAKIPRRRRVRAHPQTAHAQQRIEATSSETETAVAVEPTTNSDENVVVAEPETPSARETAMPVDEVEAAVEPQSPPALSDADAAYANAVRTRMQLGTLHRYLGIATWVTMTATLVSGFFQYYNLYGFGAGLNTNPCATGGAIFGQDQCSGIPWIHRISWISTAAFYTATNALALFMPDPNDVGSARGAYGDRLRAHKVLRWVHFGGMLIQMVLGLGVGNGWFGDRANDYGTLQAIATIHQVTGIVTWGALTAAGALMTF